MPECPDGPPCPIPSPNSRARAIQQIANPNARVPVVTIEQLSRKVNSKDFGDFVILLGKDQEIKYKRIKSNKLPGFEYKLDSRNVKTLQQFIGKNIKILSINYNLPSAKNSYLVETVYKLK